MESNMKYFVYFTNSGNGDFVADILKEYGYKPVKIELVKPLKKMNFFRIMKYGGHAIFKKKANIKDIDIKFSEEDEVVVGSPIWGDHLSTPVNAFLAKFSLSKDKTRFILYPAGKETSKSLIQIKELGFAKEPLVVPYPKKYVEESKTLLEIFK